MKEGQEIVFIKDGTLMKGILWEKGMLDHLVKSPDVTGLFYIRHEQIVSNGATKEAVNFLSENHIKEKVTKNGEIR